MLFRSGLQVQRVVEDGYETVETPLPAVVTVSNEFGEPRYPKLPQIMAAAKKTVTQWKTGDLGLAASEVGAAGARLKLESLLWRLGSSEDADAVLAPEQRFLPVGANWTAEQLQALPGLHLHDLMQLPIERLRTFFGRLTLPSTLADEALKLLLEEINTRLKYLCDEIGRAHV